MSMLNTLNLTIELFLDFMNTNNWVKLSPYFRRKNGSRITSVCFSIRQSPNPGLKIQLFLRILRKGVFVVKQAES